LFPRNRYWCHKVKPRAQDEQEEVRDCHSSEETHADECLVTEARKAHERNCTMLQLRIDIQKVWITCEGHDP